ncbi:hypothetical protein AWB79_01970 [Caballeronia hypogeia]|uniref:Uncharacterized protein n=1 Tax=Caballeronia hypogeia TaxID=1777140 RepID=A0A158A5Q7_9BURK|nr:hypothetical protein [Caballeronia hypogeia]SAK53049.1 hypothetical protein AWB79_01970 [Caballeronia hypogeia]
MAVDFCSLPEQMTDEPKPPSPVVWVVLFVVAIAIGIGLTLTLWPKGRSPQCWQFYAWMFGVPSVCWAVLLAGRIHLYETALLQVQSHNTARASTVYDNTVYARRPLFLLARASITPMLDGEDAPVQVAESFESAIQPLDNKPLSLSARVVAGEKSLESKQVRETREVRLHSDLPRDGNSSTAELLEIVFTRLIDEIQPAVDRIPLGVPLEIWLDVQDEVAVAETLDVWQRESSRLNRSTDHPCILKPGESVMALDAWLDDDSHTRFKFVLLISAQIRDDVPANSGEAAVAMLFGWPELSDSLNFEPLAHVHRPVIQSSDHERSVLATALDWGAARPEQIDRAWESGLPEVQHFPVSDSTGFASDIATSNRTSIDEALGHTGAASGWLAIAMAAERAGETTCVQLISTSAQQQPCWLVVRPHQAVTPVSE